MTDHAELIAEAHVRASWYRDRGHIASAAFYGRLCDALAALAKERDANLRMYDGAIAREHIANDKREQAERERDTEKARADAYQIEHGKVLGLWQACEKERDEALRLLAESDDMVYQLGCGIPPEARHLMIVKAIARHRSRHKGS